MAQTPREYVPAKKINDYIFHVVKNIEKIEFTPPIDRTEFLKKLLSERAIGGTTGILAEYPATSYALQGNEKEQLYRQDYRFDSGAEGINRQALRTLAQEKLVQLSATTANPAQAQPTSASAAPTYAPPAMPYPAASPTPAQATQASPAPVPAKAAQAATSAAQAASATSAPAPAPAKPAQGSASATPSQAQGSPAPAMPNQAQGSPAPAKSAQASKARQPSITEPFPESTGTATTSTSAPTLVPSRPAPKPPASVNEYVLDIVRNIDKVIFTPNINKIDFLKSVASPYTSNWNSEKTYKFLASYSGTRYSYEGKSGQFNKKLPFYPNGIGNDTEKQKTNLLAIRQLAAEKLLSEELNNFNHKQLDELIQCTTFQNFRTRFLEILQQRNEADRHAFLMDKNILGDDVIQRMAIKAKERRKDFSHARVLTYIATAGVFATEVQRKGTTSTMKPTEQDQTDLADVKVKSEKVKLAEPLKLANVALFPGDKLVSAANFKKPDQQSVKVEIVQDHTGCVQFKAPPSFNELPEESKDIIAMEIARKALLSYNPENGSLVLEGKNKDQAKRVMGCLAYLMQQPGYPKVEVRSCIKGLDSIDLPTFRKDKKLQEYVKTNLSDSSIFNDKSSKNSDTTKSFREEATRKREEARKLEESAKLPKYDETDKKLKL